MSGSAGQVRRWRVSGRVQGVSFRYATQREAARLGIEHGWARNLPDGDVDVCARGSSASLDALAAWLGQGPSLARVSSVREVSPPEQPPEGFHTG